MMSGRICFIGLDAPQNAYFLSQVPGAVVAHEMLPKIVVQQGRLLVDASSGFGMTAVSKVVFHGIFEHDHDLIAGLAVWGGPCLPNAKAMMDCRLKLPCLVRALRFSEFAAPARGFASAGATYFAESNHVAKWGDWHCGENKQEFSGDWQADESSIVEPFLAGGAVRVVVIGDQF
ncbi:hypothetical protein Enr8_32540 [Blastopirellula retiformator]|uniref:Uncharacterized protein n=1 Tax=Blastopirellula retiformator TaxID=2527970 RepID=A0A5C5V646_9BACT|nr:hypothetical protein Enr8_32540 [Blastopirellula retiformator]